MGFVLLVYEHDLNTLENDLSGVTIVTYTKCTFNYHLGISSPPTVVNRICRAIFGGFGDMIYGVAKLLTFITIFGVLLALTVYYFDVQLDLQNLKMTTNISKFKQLLILVLITAHIPKGFSCMHKHTS